MTSMAMALLKAPVFFPDPTATSLIPKARREMVAEFAMRRRAAVRTLAEGGFSATRLSPADLEFAVRVMGARRTSKRRGDSLVLPGMPGWARAGWRKR
jgi:hypothetical protein